MFFVTNISISRTLAKVPKVLVLNKHQESITDTKLLKAKDYLSAGIKAVGSYFYRLCSKLEKKQYLNKILRLAKWNSLINMMTLIFQENKG